MWQRKQEFYDYDIFGLMNRYYTASEYSAARNCSESDIPYCYRTEWRYKYNPFNEREQKRLYYSFNGDANGSLYPWVYYQLGINNEQYTTYNGLQIADPTFAIGPSEVCTNPYPQIVFMYPVEYNVFGNDNKADMTYRLNNSGTWSKDVMCYDHIGNVLMSLRANTSTNSFDITSENYYRAYGQKIDVISPVTHDRLGFINKEKDVENDLGDFGVRKYDESIGRFTNTDKLFEKYAGWTPYQYSMNNPVNMFDNNGKDVLVLQDKEGAHGFGHSAVLIGNDKTVWKLYSKNGAQGWNPLFGKSKNQSETKFQSIKAFETDKDKQQTKYEKGYLIKTTEEQDKKMQDAAKKSVESDYNVLNASCIDVTSDALEAGGLNPGTYLLEYKDQMGITHYYLVKSPIPNERYEDIKKNNSGKEINLDKERQTNK